MMMPISLIENKNTNVYIMQNLDLKYLHKKKPCINPFRCWQSRAGCLRGQRVPTSSLLRSPSEPCIKIIFFRRVLSRFVQFYLKMIKTLVSQQNRPRKRSSSGSRNTGRVLQCTPTSPPFARLGDLSLVVFGFGMCEDVRLQVGGLRKLFVAAVKRAHVRAVSSVNAYMCAQVKVQWEALATALECALEN